MGGRGRWRLVPCRGLLGGGLRPCATECVLHLGDLMSLVNLSLLPGDAPGRPLSASTSTYATKA